MYAVDSIVRRSEALQQTNDALTGCVLINEALAKQTSIEDEYNIVVSQNGVKQKLRVHIDNSIPDGCAVIPQGVHGVEMFDAAYAEVKLSNKAN